ncbi:hypothetical protein [Mangrovicoccus ximenensis]|uniref:hypothetical protein n=1 Tax=Mangrovicoccus ximenensis TaxID=1911570 RepID=UPI0011AE1EB3|nr:hypothetical protein [Mangrovicoccus ximenensis]
MTTKKSSPGLFRETGKPLTPFEKTAAAAKDIIDTETQKRADRTAALRAARMERDAEAEQAGEPAEPSKDRR